MNINLTDTIAAISTPIGESGIGIVRLSGKDAIAIAGKIFASKDGKKPSEFKTYTVHYGWIVEKSPQSTVHRLQKENSELWTMPACRQGRDGGLSTNIIDEVLLTVMRAPRSYTKEDIVEINCHSGIVALRRVLDLILESGCRLAEPGEFTKRAFLNGRIDLTQAEAVLDIIKAKTDSALEVSIGQLKGVLSKEINKARQDLLNILSVLEANIDFPEDEINPVDLKDFLSRLSAVNNDFNHVLAASKAGRILREGVSVVICGKPNVGKSSLLNALLRQERSIVTPIAGTTRDTIEEIIDIKGIPIRIVDTAGIIEPRDLIERKAIERAKHYIKLADLVILVFDNSKNLTKEDDLFFKRLDGKAVIAVINKIDLKAKINRKKIIRKFKYSVDISAKNMKNILLLEEKIADLVYQGQINCPESILISNVRQIGLIKKAQKLVAETIDSVDNNTLIPIELAAQGIKDALGFLDELLGKKFSEDLLDKIFNDFCIGK